MNIRKRLASLLSNLIHTPSDKLSDIPFSAVTLEYAGRVYRATALERRVSIQRLPEGAPREFSTDQGAAERELAQEVFDGFEWELTTLCQLIDLYEQQVP